MLLEENPAHKGIDSAEIQAVKVAVSDQWKKLQVCYVEILCCRLTMS